jgi:hypothetical protein
MHQFLGAFAKLREAIIGFVMSACLSVLMGQLGFNNVLRKSFRL